MRLYVLDKTDGTKIYLKDIASNRRDLAAVYGSHRVKVGEHVYHVNEICAEPSENTAPAMALGGVVGVLGGVPGVILGGLVGALLGKSSDDEDEVKANLFNRSASSEF